MTVVKEESSMARQSGPALLVSSQQLLWEGSTLLVGRLMGDTEKAEGGAGNSCLVRGHHCVPGTCIRTGMSATIIVKHQHCSGV